MCPFITYQPLAKRWALIEFLVGMSILKRIFNWKFSCYRSLQQTKKDVLLYKLFYKASKTRTSCDIFFHKSQGCFLDENVWPCCFCVSYTFPPSFWLQREDNLSRDVFQMDSGCPFTRSDLVPQIHVDSRCTFALFIYLLFDLIYQDTFFKKKQQCFGSVLTKRHAIATEQ